ncbi:hypothetical protein [Methanoculleus chikugoensis]|uniref:hypothetical protein n=1 Tax=Methanoculleus chikugoensis TaxID=118126 RepID=UPI000B211F62|nr:hypothetical protein [Methanoculleus chikugoensis]
MWVGAGGIFIVLQSPRSRSVARQVIAGNGYLEAGDAFGGDWLAGAHRPAGRMAREDPGLPDGARIPRRLPLRVWDGGALCGRQILRRADRRENPLQRGRGDEERVLEAPPSLRLDPRPPMPSLRAAGFSPSS